MHDLNMDYISELHHGIVEAICRVSADRQSEGLHGEAKTLYIGSAEVCQALTMALTGFLESTPDLDTPAKVRALSETVAKKIRSGIVEIRRLRENTGGDPLPVVVIRGN